MNETENQILQPQAALTLKDVTDEDLLEIFYSTGKSYQEVADFLSLNCDIETSRQAIYKRLKPYMLKKAQQEKEIKEKTQQVLLDAINSTDLKVRLMAVRIINHQKLADDSLRIKQPRRIISPY